MMPFVLLILAGLVIENAADPSLFGTHFFLNQERVLVDNTLKTVTTLARPYDLVAFIRQAERLARVELLQTYIDAVDDVDESLDQPASSQKPNHFFDSDIPETDDKCHDFLRDGESLIFKILKNHLYDSLQIPLELKNISYPSFTDESTTKILTCQDFCQIKTNLRTFDHLPSIGTRYDDKQVVHIDDEDLNKFVNLNYDQEAQWASRELMRNRTSWLAYVHLSRYYHSSSSYSNAVDCLRCALSVESVHEDIILVDLANIVFRYGYLRDSIILIERALDYHLHSRMNNLRSVFIRAILHYYLGNLCTIDSRFLLAIQFYNRTRILLERVKKYQDEQFLSIFSSNSLGQLSLQQLTSLSRQKIDALQCHLLLEASLKQKHQDLQKKLAQLNQLQAINDELTHLHALIKHDMSHGQSMVEYLRRLKQENVQLICDWKSMMNPQTANNPSINKSVCQRETYSKMIQQFLTCSMDVMDHFPKRQMNGNLYDEFSCRPRNDWTNFYGENYSENDDETNDSLTYIGYRRKSIEFSQSMYKVEDAQHNSHSIETSEQMTLTSTTTSPTLTSRLPTDVIPNMKKDFYLKHSTELYPPLKEKATIKLIETQFPQYSECQIHYFGLPSIGDYPTIWLPLENKGLLNIKHAFYRGLNHPHKHYPLPWSPPLCTLNTPISESMPIIENHPILMRSSRKRAPTNRYDRNMLLNLYFYIDTTIDEQLPIEEFGQRLRSVASKDRHLLPEWIIHLLSSLYWRVNGHLPHAIDCGLKAHETIMKSADYKQWTDVTLINMANILYLWGKYEDALDLTEQAYALNSHEPNTNYFLGNLLALTKNNHTAAQEYYRRTLAIDPTHIYARRQLRISHCHTMYTAWQLLGCKDNKDNCDEMNIRSLSMKCHLFFTSNYYQICDATVVLAPNDRDSNARSIPCQEVFIGDHGAIDRWLNRSSQVLVNKRNVLLTEAQRAYRTYGLCTSSSSMSSGLTLDECSQGFLVTLQGEDIGHLILIYDQIKQTFGYTIVFTNDYEHLFQRENQMKCLIYGTGRKSSKCRDKTLNIVDLNEMNPKHNTSWWRDPSMLYEHLKEMIEIMNNQQRLKNRTNIQQYDLYENYFTDQYLLSKSIQEKYLLKNPVSFTEKECQNKSSNSYSQFLPTWISPQTKNIPFNATVFKPLRKLPRTNSEPICSLSKVEQPNNTKNSQLIRYIFKRVNKDLTMYRPETILRPVLASLLFEKNSNNIQKEVDEKILMGSLLAAGLHSSTYNTSWLFYHTVSLYWRLMGNASQALNCLYQSHIYSPIEVQDLTYLSMALILYNSQFHIDEAIYLLYESLSTSQQGLLLSHFTLGNAMARKGHLNLAEKWYQSTLKLKSDFEPAKQRLRAIQC